MMIKAFIKISALQIILALFCILMFGPVFAQNDDDSAPASTSEVDRTHTRPEADQTSARICETGCFPESATADRNSDTSLNKRAAAETRELRVAEVLRGDSSTAPAKSEGSKKAK